MKIMYEIGGDIGLAIMIGRFFFFSSFFFSLLFFPFLAFIFSIWAPGDRLVWGAIGRKLDT